MTGEALKCEHCKRCEQTALFQLCAHEKSHYLDNNAKDQLHTTGHMRERGGCGQVAHFFDPTPAPPLPVRAQGVLA